MLLLIVLGLIWIVTGLSFHLGYYRGVIVYWTTFTSGIYALVPSGVGLVFLSLVARFPYPDGRGIWLMAVAFVFLTIGIVLGLTMPQFLTPWWFRFLRENYDDFFIPILLKDASKDYSAWKQRTQTLEGLQEWAAEVKRKTRVE
jgi:hypothetical protein